MSKLSAVEITITTQGKTSLNKVANFRRGNGSFTWKPGTTGTYTVQLAAKELRTGQGLRTRDQRRDRVAALAIPLSGGPTDHPLHR